MVRIVSLVIASASILAACGLSPLGQLGPSPECASHTNLELCEQARGALLAELGEQAQGGRLRIDPVTCAHGTCWTPAYFTAARGGAEQLLWVDWRENGEIDVSYAVGH